MNLGGEILQNVFICAKVDQLPYIEDKLLPPLRMGILITGPYKPLRNWDDFPIPYGNHGSFTKCRVQQIRQFSPRRIVSRLYGYRSAQTLAFRDENGGRKNHPC